MGASASKRSAGLGQLTLDNKILRYEANQMPYTSWSVPMDEVLVIGEYSTDNGPFLEDLFCEFVVNETTWYEVPYDALGVREAMAMLAKALEAELPFELPLSSRFQSRVMWPECLRGVPLFEFRDVRRSLWDRLVRWWYPSEVESVLSPEVLAYLANARSPAPTSRRR